MLRTTMRAKPKATSPTPGTPREVYHVRTVISKDAESLLLDEQRRRYEASGRTNKPNLMAIARELLEAALLALPRA